jgi:hypothetical protein
MNYDYVKINSFSIENKDTFVAPYTLCSKEVLQKAYTDKIGKYINFCGVERKVKDVKVTDEFITIELE